MRTTLLLSALFLCLAFRAVAQPAPVGQATCTPKTPAPASPALAANVAGNFAEAEKLYTAQIASAPNAEDYAGLVHTQLEQGKLSAAQASARAAVAALPSSADVKALQAEALLRSGDLAGAGAAVNKASGLNPCSAEAVYVVARISQLTGRRATAARQLNRAHALAPGDATIAAARAETLPIEQRGPVLKNLLAHSPALPPDALNQLAVWIAISDANLACTATWPDKPVVEALHGVMVYGTHARGYGIPMKIGTASLSNVELDSGVAGIVLNPHDAKAAGVHALPGVAPAANGTYYAAADVIKVGAAEFHNCPVRVATNETLGSANSLIGTDFFRERLIHIDYIDRSVTFTAPAASADGLVDRTTPASERDWTPAFFAGSDILIPTMINNKGPYLMAIDTGAYISVYAPVIGGEHPAAYSENQFQVRGSATDFVMLVPQTEGGDADHALVHGPDGHLLAVDVPVKKPNLRFYNNSRLDVDSVSLDITPKSQSVGIEISGLLGFSNLEDFTIDIDYRNALVHMVYDTLHRYQEREQGNSNSVIRH